MKRMILTEHGMRPIETIQVGAKIWGTTNFGWTEVLSKQIRTMEVYEFDSTGGKHYGSEEHFFTNEDVRVKVKYMREYDINIGPDNFDTVFSQQAINHGYEFYQLHETDLVERYMTENRDQVASFLRGFYSGAGCFTNGKAAFKTTNRFVLEQIQILLASIGCASYHTNDKDGTYYDLSITRDRENFGRLVGFIDQTKQNKLQNYVADHSRKARYKCCFSILNKTALGMTEMVCLKVNNPINVYWCSGHSISDPQ